MIRRANQAYDYRYFTSRWSGPLNANALSLAVYGVRIGSTHTLVDSTKRVVWVYGLGWLIDAWGDMKTFPHYAIPHDRTCYCAGYYYPATGLVRWIGSDCKLAHPGEPAYRWHPSFGPKCACPPCCDSFIHPDTGTLVGHRACKCPSPYTTPAPPCIGGAT